MSQNKSFSFKAKVPLFFAREAFTVKGYTFMGSYGTQLVEVEYHVVIHMNAEEIKGGVLFVPTNQVLKFPLALVDEETDESRVVRVELEFKDLSVEKSTGEALGDNDFIPAISFEQVSIEEAEVIGGLDKDGTLRLRAVPTAQFKQAVG